MSGGKKKEKKGVVRRYNTISENPKLYLHWFKFLSKSIDFKLEKSTLFLLPRLSTPPQKIQQTKILNKQNFTVIFLPWFFTQLSSTSPYFLGFLCDFFSPQFELYSFQKPNWKELIRICSEVQKLRNIS